MHERFFGFFLGPRARELSIMMFCCQATSGKGATFGGEGSGNPLYTVNHAFCLFRRRRDKKPTTRPHKSQTTKNKRRCINIFAPILDAANADRNTCESRVRGGAGVSLDCLGRALPKRGARLEPPPF